LKTTSLLLELSTRTEICSHSDLVTVTKRALASRGTMEFRQADNVVVTVWQDTRPVVVLSTHDPSNIGTVSRKQKDGRR